MAGIQQSRRKWSDLLAQAEGIERNAQRMAETFGESSHAAKRAREIARRIRARAELYKPNSEEE